MSAPEAKPDETDNRSLSERYLDRDMTVGEYADAVTAEADTMRERDLLRRYEQLRREEINISLRSVTGPRVRVSPELATRAGIPTEKANSKFGKGILGLLSRLH